MATRTAQPSRACSTLIASKCCAAPQGTLFGSGSEGGTVRFITPEPSLHESSVYARTGASVTKYGSPSWEAGIAGGTPIIEDKLGLRVSVSGSQTGGYVDHGDYYTGLVDQKDYNSQKSFSLRVGLKWLITENLTVSPSYYHQQLNANGNGQFYLPDDNQGINTSAPSYIDYYNRYGGKFDNYGHFGDGVGGGNYVNATRVIPTSSQLMDLWALNLKYELSNVDLLLNSSLYENKQKNVVDFTSLNFAVFPLFVGGSPVYFPSNPAAKSPEYDTNKNSVVTHEFRAQSSNADARVQWVVGGFINNQNLFSQSYIDSPDWGLVLPDAIPNFADMGYYGCDPANLGPCMTDMLGFYQGRYSIYLDTWGWDREKAIFGQADINITKQLTATIGLRYSDMSFRSKLVSAGVMDGLPPVTEDKITKTTMTTPKFGLRWTFEDGKMVYATAAKGGRNGGVNQKITSPACLARLADAWGMPDGAPLGYDPDTVWSYELGTKFNIQRKLSVDAAIYQIDWDNMIRSVGIGGNTGCFFSFTTNLGTARSRGAEIDIQYRPIDSLLLSANAGHAKVQSTETIGVPDPNHPTGIMHNAQGQPQLITRDGAILAGSNTTVNLAAQYSFTAFEKASYARADVRYVGTPSKGDSWDPNSSQYAGANMLFASPSLTTLNLRLGAQLSDWDVSLYVNNLSNTQPIQKLRPTNSLPWMTGSVMTRPREMGFTAVYRY